MKRGVVLVDGGGANIGSLRYALERLGIHAQLSADPRRVSEATHVILPGVGAAGQAMKKLQSHDLIGTLRARRGPLLGVCLGMQLLFDASEEGDTPCLGLLPGLARKLPASPRHRVPHMGWNQLDRTRDDALMKGIDADAHVYFVHSFALPVGDSTIASSEYGDPFSAVVRRGNVCGMQFHPERSGTVGARLLANFLDL